MQSGLRGGNATVVGVLLAALHHPVWSSVILSPADFAIRLAAFLMLALWAVLPWFVGVPGR